MNSKDVAITAVFYAAIVGMLLRPVFVAWGRRLDSSAANAQMANELDELRSRVAELEAERGQLAELEERVDFAERVLARNGDRMQLPMENTPV